jgi:L-ascorbate 6-phosphate lactonase
VEDSRVMQEIRNYAVPRGSVGIWWFGQNGFIFKSPAGTLVSVDLYLTNSCEGLVEGLDLSRKVPVLLRPEEVDVDVYTCTHNHQDHTDPETLRGLKNKDTMCFVGPNPSCEVFRRQGVESGRIVPAWPKSEFEFRDVAMRGTFALPTDESDLCHMGFLYRFHQGPCIYVTGDTDYHELLLEAGRHSPDLVITVINGGFNNLSHFEAAELVGKIKPKMATPCHYDMFPDNSVDPLQFRSAMKLKASDVVYQQLEHGKAFLFSKR